MDSPEPIQRKNKNIALKTAVFFVNALAVVVGMLLMKEQNDEKVEMKTDTNSSLEPIEKETLATQEKIVTDRENKLRDLSNTPSDLKKQQTTTTTTTTTTTPSTSSNSGSSNNKSSSSKADTTTKTS